MLAFIWNLRGFKAPGRRGQLSDYIRKEHPDFVGLQETHMESFSPAELASIDHRNAFAWK